MNIAEIELENFGSWSSVTLPIEPSVSLISGQNGSGKSTLLAGIEFALFGVPSGAERLIRRGTDHARARCTVDTERGRIIAERSIRLSSGRATVGLKLWLVDAETGTEEPLTAATVGETQRILESFLGVSQALLRASSFSMQGMGASFCESAPSERKARLSEALGLALWAPLHDAAKAEKRAADEAANVARAELERIDGATHRYLEANGALSRAQSALDVASETAYLAEEEATRLAAEAGAARDARREHAAAVEAEARARADHERAGVERQAADEALARAKAAAANAPSVEDAKALAHEADLQLAEAELRMGDAETEQRRSSERARDERQKLADAEREQREAIQAIRDLQGRLDTADAGTCGECGQPLVSDEAKELRGRLLSALDQAQRVGLLADEDVALRHHRAADAERRVTGDDYLDQVRSALNEARYRAEAARRKLAEAQTIQSLAGSIDAAQQRARDASDRQHETGVALREASAAADAEMQQPSFRGDEDEKHAAAVEALATARSAHSAAAAELARAEEAAKLAERQAAEETAARARLEVATREAAVAGHLAAGFSPSGVPAMIVDSVLGDLADEANRVLAELASPIRVDLRSQRVTQKGDVVDALEIVVTMGGMEASYETLSGGERTRVALALRAALTRLLASKRGARVRLLVCDEPSGLDASGSEAFADVLGEFVRAGIFDSCIVVTHDDRLADRIDRVIRVEKDSAGVSRLLGAPVLQEAQR